MKRKLDAEQAEQEYVKKQEGSTLNVMGNVDLANS